MNRLQKFLIKILSEDQLSHFRWYRKHIGGYWNHSKVMGWQNKPLHCLDRDLHMLKLAPSLYDYGRDIEYYGEEKFMAKAEEYLKKS